MYRNRCRILSRLLRSNIAIQPLNHLQIQKFFNCVLQNQLKIQYLRNLCLLWSIDICNIDHRTETRYEFVASFLAFLGFIHGIKLDRSSSCFRDLDPTVPFVPILTGVSAIFVGANEIVVALGLIVIFLFTKFEMLVYLNEIEDLVFFKGFGDHDVGLFCSWVCSGNI
ncbi:hypothetical protein L1887_39362 [Cichorium endivia]|nr:hypothetical protein L1887_39362 [Cichorium endivia]